MKGENLIVLIINFVNSSLASIVKAKRLSSLDTMYVQEMWKAFG